MGVSTMPTRGAAPTRGGAPTRGAAPARGSHGPAATSSSWRPATTSMRVAHRATRWRGAVDLAALGVMLACAVYGFGPVWGTTGYVRPAVGGAVLGLAVAWLGAWRRWAAATVLAAAVIGYFVVGGFAALPGTTTGGVIPTATTFRQLAVGAVGGWQQFVTSVPPLHAFPKLAVVPYLLMLVTAVVAGSIALRVRRAAWAVVPVIACFAAVILLGTQVAARPVAQGLGLVLTGLVWAGWRVTTARRGQYLVTTESVRGTARRMWWYRVRTGAVMVGVAGLAGAFIAPMVLPDDPRTVLRDTVVPPLDLHQYVSPLMSFRKYAKDEKTERLFTVTGMTKDARVRMAGLDYYNGTVYDIAQPGQPGTGVFTRAGTEIASAATGTPATLSVSVSDYTGVWIPEVGNLTGITWHGARAQELADTTYYNATTQTGVATAGITKGDSYEFTTRISAVPSRADLLKWQIKNVPLPSSATSELPASLGMRAEQFTGSETDPVKKLFLLADGLKASGVYSSGLANQAPSRPGHSAERIDQLLAGKVMVGDDEQFAVALALMANKLGIPARVVFGFYPGSNTWEPGQPYVVTGGDVHAWAEVPFAGYGWVPIDAIPTEDNKVQTEPKTDQVPKPPVLEDPEPPHEPAKEAASKIEDQKKDDIGGKSVNWAQVLTVAVAVLVPLLILSLPVVLIVAYKARRYARRKRAGPPADRVSGGWREVIDTAADLGTAVPGGATRREGAGVIAQAFGSAPAVALARRADASVFGAQEPTAQEIETFWKDVDVVVNDMRNTVPRRKRVLAKLSLKSIRRPTGHTPPARGAQSKASLWKGNK